MTLDDMTLTTSTGDSADASMPLGPTAPARQTQ